MRYVKLKGQWGIAIDFIAEIVDYNESSLKNKAEKVSEGIWIVFAEKPMVIEELGRNIMSSYDMPYLKKGLRLVRSKLKNNSEYEENLIIVKYICYNFCHFQVEGLIATVMEWAAEELNFDLPEIRVDFDREKNRYHYEFENFDENVEY